MTQGIGQGSYLDMNGDEPWTAGQFEAKKRADINTQSDPDRRQDLVIIVLGHILFKMGVPNARQATDAELAEALAIMPVWTAAYNRMLAAQADYALRCQAEQVEAAQLRLQQPVDTTNPNDATERAAAQAVIDGATSDVMAVVTFRNRVPATPPP